MNNSDSSASAPNESELDARVLEVLADDDTAFEPRWEEALVDADAIGTALRDGADTVNDVKSVGDDVLADPHVPETDPPGDELGGGLGNAVGGEPATDG